jgi:hypothetical protein
MMGFELSFPGGGGGGIKKTKKPGIYKKTTQNSKNKNILNKGG